MSITKMICVVCPVGCLLNVDGSSQISGNKCARGEIYAKNEMVNPTRTVTSTVRLQGESLSRLPVKTSRPFPKGQIFSLMNRLNEITVQPPICAGQIICSDLLGTGINLVASKTVNNV